MLRITSAQMSTPGPALLLPKTFSRSAREKCKSPTTQGRENRSYSQIWCTHREKQKTKRRTIFNHRPTTTTRLPCLAGFPPPRQLFPIKWSLPLIASWLHPDRARQPYCYNDRSEITCNQLNQKAVHKFRQSSDMSVDLFPFFPLYSVSKYIWYTATPLKG